MFQDCLGKKTELLIKKMRMQVSDAGEAQGFKRQWGWQDTRIALSVLIFSSET